MMEQQKALLLFTLLLCLSHLSLDAVPVSRNLALRNQGAPIVEVADQVVTRETPIGEEEFVEGRMDFESNDYPPSGPNHHHDPKSPGKP